MYCELEYIETKNIWKCKRCGKEYSGDRNTVIYSHCRRSFPAQIVNYANAVIKHYASGAKRRDDSEVEKILEICKGCSFFDSGTCQKCGCRCNSSKYPLMNKLRMESQHCPEKKW